MLRIAAVGSILALILLCMRYRLSPLQIVEMDLDIRYQGKPNKLHEEM